MKPIKLKEIADKLLESSEDWSGFLNTETGKIVFVSSEHLGIAEEADENDDFSEYPDWERGLINQAMDIVVNWEQYEKLPDQYDINEYSIIEDFSYSYPDEVVSDKLSDAIRGKGAFRRFKDMISRLGITDEWYTHREKAFVNIAREWCEFHKIPYME